MSTFKTDFEVALQPTGMKGFSAKALAAEAQAEQCLTYNAKMAWLDVAKQYRLLAGFAGRMARK
jgi:hypothetical protein